MCVDGAQVPGLYSMAGGGRGEPLVFSSSSFSFNNVWFVCVCGGGGTFIFFNIFQIDREL